MARLEASVSAESERNLKAFTVAKMYKDVGEYETAKKYVAKYLGVRENSSMALKLYGEVSEVFWCQFAFNC